MRTPKKENVVRFSNSQATLRFFDGTYLRITNDGKISVRKGKKSYVYMPSRLRVKSGLGATEESSFWSQKIDINPEISLNIRIEKAERTRAELFFHEKDEGETVISGCFVTKEANADDWSINLINTDRFLFNLSELLNEM